MLRRGSNSGLYGTHPVVMAFEVDGEVHFSVGSRPPRGGILLNTAGTKDEHRTPHGSTYIEERAPYWEDRGWIVFDQGAEILERLRRDS